MTVWWIYLKEITLNMFCLMAVTEQWIHGKVSKVCEKEEIYVVGIPKTIDNDISIIDRARVMQVRPNI